jgi:hypothetical protein
MSGLKLRPLKKLTRQARKKQQVPRCARDDIRGSGRMFPATSHGLRFSHDPSTARPDPSATLRAGVQTTHAENASGRSAQDDRQGRRRRSMTECQVPGAGEKLS